MRLTFALLLLGSLITSASAAGTDMHLLADPFPDAHASAQAQFQPITMGGRVYEPNPDYEPMPDISATRDQYDFLSEDMTPGDVLCFHALTVHGGGGNDTSDRRRRAYSVRYTGDDVVYDRRSSTMTELENPELETGDVLDSPLFPVVWRASP